MPLTNDTKQIFNFYRGLILDLFEQEIGDHKQWGYIRSRLLKILSPNNGLEAKIVQLIERKSK